MENESLSVEEFKPQLGGQREGLLTLLQECGQAIKDDDLAPLKRNLDRLKLQIARIEANLAIQPQSAGVLLQQLEDYWIAITTRLEAKRLQHGGNLLGLSTGFSRLDNYLDGIRPGLHILMGEPSIGKSSFVNQIAFNVAKQCPCLFVTFEDTALDLLCRQISRLSGITLKKIRRGEISDGDKPALLEAKSRVTEVESTLTYLVGTRCLSGDILRGLVRESLTGDDYLVIIDHLQKFAASVGQRQDFRMAVLGLTQELRDMANEFGIPVLVVSQLARAFYDKGVDNISLDSPKESGEVEYSADSVIAIARDPKKTRTASKTGIQVKILKQRYGEKDVVLDFTFEAAFARFGERTNE